MQPERAERIAQIVEQALEVEVGRRGPLLVDLCGDDQELFVEVASLLHFQEKARDFIETPAVEAVAELLADERTGLQAGDALDGYKIISLLGEGGMGEVYLADDVSLGRKVAIKLLKYGLGTANFVRHFHQEEKILAGLIHPNIAQLYGGAVTTNGVPYFVMEYVNGPRFDDYCRDKGLPISERLELFRKICSAVSYAHQHLVIHRDIKPANIRVTSEGEPKLLDFGIAKLVDPATSAIEQTMTFASVMTPEYASPEQIRGENITTASDVYSLGVVLYELLTEQKPYKIDNRSATSIARAITEQEPTRPSITVAKNQQSKTNASPARTNQKALRGDLDNIVLKAIRKEPDRRYASVNQFSEDIRRHLEGRPVIARKDTVGYRASKFVRRNKIGVAAAALVFLTLIGGIVATGWEAHRTNQQRLLAEREKLKAERVNAFLQDMLGAAAPEVKGVDVKVVDLLSEASRRAQTELTNQPDVMAGVLATLGRTYISLTLFGQAEKDLRAALAASLKANGEFNSTTATTMGWLGLALAYQDKAIEGEAMSRKAVALQRKLHPEGNADLAVALYSVGMNLTWQNHGKAAEPFLQEAVDLLGKYLGENNGYYMAALTELAIVRDQSGKSDDAEKLYRRAIEIGSHVERRYRIFLAQATGYFGEHLTTKGSYAEAETNLRQSLAIYREVTGDDNVNTATIGRDIARVHFLQGNYASAEVEYRQSLRTLSHFYGAQHPLLLGVKAALGVTLSRLGQPAEGEVLVREALELRRKTLPKDNFLIPLTESALGECLIAQKHFTEARPLLVSGYNGLKAKFGDSDVRVIEARQRLDKLSEAK
jgi:serine/threonine-protein kinase